MMTESSNTGKRITIFAFGCIVGGVVGYTIGKLVGKSTFINDLQNSNEILQSDNANDYSWKIPVIKTNDKTGDTYIDYKTINLKPKGSIGQLSDPIKVETFKFRTTPADYDYDSHCTPSKQFIINLDAPLLLKTSQNNESILLKTGQVFALEDIKGKGHISKAVNNLPRKSIFVTYNNAMSL